MPDQQQQINYGAAPNDGQGDPLRDAFIKTDDNFDAIWNAGPVGSNVTVLNNTVAVVNVNGNLILQPNGVGVIQANASIVPNSANIRDLGAADRRWRRVYLQTLNTVDYEVEGDLTVSGNLTIQGDTIQVGNLITDARTLQLSNTAANAVQANGSGITVGATDDIATFLYDSTSNVWQTNIGITALGTVNAEYFVGNGSLLTGLPESYSNVNVAAYLPTYSGNISAGNLVVNSSGNTWSISGRQITGPGGAYWLSNPAQSLDIFSGAPGENIRVQAVDANGLVQTRMTMTGEMAEIFVENGVNHAWRFNETGITEFPGTITPVVSLAATEYALGNATNPWSDLYVSGNSFQGNLFVTGNIIPMANGAYSLGNATNYWSNLWVANNTIYIGGVPLGITGNVLTVNGEPVLSNDSDSSITTTGNITADYFIGDGSQLTGLPESYGNANVAAYLPTYTGNIGTAEENLRVESGKISLNSSKSDSLYTDQGGSYTSASWSGNDIDFTAVEDIYLETLLERFDSHFAGSGSPWAAGYSNITVRINDTQTLTVTGASFSGGTNWRVTVAETPASDPTAVTSAEFLYDFVSTLELDGDDNSYAIALDDSNFVINTRRDIRLTSGDDVYIDGRSNMRLRNLSRTSGITIETDWNNEAYEWQFDEVGTLTTPGDITVAGDITGTSSASTLVLAAEPDSNTAIQLNNAVDSTISTVANLEIRTDVSATAKTWTFDTAGNLTAPGNLAVGTGGNVNVLTVKTEAGVISIGNQNDGTFVVTDPNFDPSIYVAGQQFYITTNGAGEDSPIFTFGEYGTANVVFPGNLSLGDGVDSKIFNPANNISITANTASWQFGTDGVLTAPGNISATNFIVSESLIGADASPAPTISGFSTITATGNVTGGNLTTSGQVVATGNITGGNMRATSYRNASGDSILGDFVFANNTLQTDNGDGGITLSIFGPDQADPPALIEKAWLFGNTGTFSNPGAIDATGNITGANLITGGLLSATGNVTGGNLTTAGTVAVDTLTITNNRIDAITQFAIATSNTTSGNSSSILLDRNGSGIGISLEDTGGGPYSWNFGQDNILFPDGSRQYSAYGNANVVANLAALGSNPISTTGNIAAGNINANVAGYSIGYRDIPQVSFTGNATIATTDAGKHFYSTESTDYVLTIANNASQGFAVGAAISVVNQGTGNITIAQGSGVSLYLAGNATSGNRTLSTFGMATIMKVATDTWFINGTGVA